VLRKNKVIKIYFPKFTQNDNKKTVKALKTLNILNPIAPTRGAIIKSLHSWTFQGCSDF